MRQIVGLLLIMVSIQVGWAQVAPTPEKICPLTIGENIPNIELTDASGTKVALKNILKNQRTVIVMYRGGWCPYCNKHMADLARVENEILGLGYKVLAISPESPSVLKENEAKFKFKYQLLSDSKTQLAKALGIAFKAPSDYEKVVDKASGGENKDILPVPSIFVTNSNGEIIFEYVNPDFKKRISGGMLVAVLSHL